MVWTLNRKSLQFGPVLVLLGPGEPDPSVAVWTIDLHNTDTVHGVDTEQKECTACVCLYCRARSTRPVQSFSTLSELGVHLLQMLLYVRRNHTDY